MASAEAQPALATTKRKFHKLLDNLTASTSATTLASTLQESNASTTSLEPTGSPEPACKRPRSAHTSDERQRNISAGQERIRVLKEQLLTPRRNATVRVVGKPTAQPTPIPSPSPSTATSHKVPNYQPYSQEHFLERLKTFADVKKWTNKPDEISEVEWAKRGWSCDTWNTVACKGGCEARIAVKLRPKRKDATGKVMEMSEDLAVNVETALVKRYRDLIVTAHEEDCLWRRKGCQDDIYHLPIANRTKSTTGLLSRYSSFLPLSADLPLLSNISYPSPPTPSILSSLPRSFFSPSQPPTTPTETVAFTFALFGWTGSSESRISLATCDHCFQRLGLWLSSDTRLREMSAKLGVGMHTLRLNLLEAHREHCPWKNGVVQGNSTDGPIAGMPAWQTLQFIILGGRDATASSRTKDRDMHRDTDVPPTPSRASHRRAADSVDVGSESGLTYPRGSMENEGRPAVQDDDEEEEEQGLQNKWRKLKAKLKRTASKRSLRSVKSVKSVKSAKSVGKEK